MFECDEEIPARDTANAVINKRVVKLYSTFLESGVDPDKMRDFYDNRLAEATSYYSEQPEIALWQSIKSE